MEAAKRITTVIARSHGCVAARCIHYTPQCMATRSMASPKVARARKQPSNPAFIAPRQSDAEDLLPPVVMLDSARKSGVIDVDASAAHEFLRDYLRTMPTAQSGWERRLCDTHKISPGTVTILAGILRRCRQHKQHILATQLMLSASLLGDKSATFELIHSAIKTGKLGQFAEPLQQLGVLAKKNNDPEAMMLLGKVLLSQEKDQEALGWLQKSTRPPTGSQEISGAGDAILNEALVLLRLGRKEEGEEAIRKAALELDEPAAYFYLSHLVEPGSSVQRVYLLKAASSGVREACHNLGALELAEIEKKSQKPTSFQDYGMAREWFQVAAADGFGLSMMNLALMYKAVGEEEESMRWIQKALEIPEVKEQALDLERQWDKERANLH